MPVFVFFLFFSPLYKTATHESSPHFAPRPSQSGWITGGPVLPSKIDGLSSLHERTFRDKRPDKTRSAFLLLLAATLFEERERRSRKEIKEMICVERAISRNCVRRDFYEYLKRKNVNKEGFFFSFFTLIFSLFINTIIYYQMY